MRISDWSSDVCSSDLTEAGPVISCNRPAAGLKMDTVGPPLMNTEVRIADDGEICVRGELVMHGYWRNEAETQRVLVPDPAEPDKGTWLHTGDKIGRAYCRESVCQYEWISVVADA